MADIKDGERDEVAGFVRRCETPLAEQRQKDLARIAELKEVCHRMAVHCVAIGISPRDDVLGKFERGQITDNLNRFICKMRRRSENGALVPFSPLRLFVVGEYSPQHRWHYHGLIGVANIKIMDDIKKRICRKFGRCVSEVIRNEPDYIDYMFKGYTGKYGAYYMFDEKECVCNFLRE